MLLQTNFDYVFIPEMYHLVWGMYIDGKTIPVIARISGLNEDEV